MKSEDQFAPIAALDLDPVKVKLMHEESGEGWSLAYVDAVEFEYRRFLYLVKKFPHEQVAPLFDVDVFWHYHILDTMKYAVDCEAVFGYFLHHFPYVGLRGDEDREAHHRVGARMRELYEHTYGEDYIRQDEKTLSAGTGKGASFKPFHAGSPSVRLNMAAFSISVPPNGDAPRVEASEQTTAFSISVPPSVDAARFGAQGRAAFSISVPPSAGATSSDAQGRAAFSISVPPNADAACFDAQGRAAAAILYSDRPRLSRTA